MKKTLALLLSLSLLGMNFSVIPAIAEDQMAVLNDVQEDAIRSDKIFTVTARNADSVILNDGYSLSRQEIGKYAEESFFPYRLEYGDVLYIDWNYIVETFPAQFEFKPGVRIQFLGKAKDYYQDNLEELVATEIQDEKIILTEKNPENPENPAVYELPKTHKWLKDNYSPMVGEFNVDEMEVGDYGVFAVNPDTQQAICAIEVHYGNAVDTSQTAEFEMIDVSNGRIFIRDLETEEYYHLEIDNKVKSVMGEEALWALSGGDILLFTVDDEGNPEIPLKVTYEMTVEDFVKRNMLYTVIGVSEDGSWFYLDNGCELSAWEIERYAETPFTPEYGDVLCIDCNCFLDSVPGQFCFNSGVRIYPVSKAGDYYKDDLKELIVTEVVEYSIKLTETNPEDPENPAVYFMPKVSSMFGDNFTAKLNGFDLDTLEVGASGLFAVNPDQQEVICAVEIHHGENQTAEFELIDVYSESLFIRNPETGKFYDLKIDDKVKSVMGEDALQALSSWDILLFTVDDEGNPEIPLKVTHEVTVEDLVEKGMLYTVIGVNEDGTDYFLDNDCTLSVWEIEDHAETPFTPEYGDVLCINCNYFNPTFPGQFCLNSGVQIYPMGKAEDYYKDDLKKMIVTEVQDYTIILAEENPEDPVNPVTYKLHKIHPWVEGYYLADLDGFNVDTLEVGDSGVFAVNPDQQEVICAVEIQLGENHGNSSNSGDSVLEKGDVTGNGEVDISDVVLMNRVCVGVDEISEKQLQAGDIDKNGKIDLSDSMLVLRYLVGLVDSLEQDF